jgi:ATP-binding cassette subfamily B (MDR/TAP) protein 1
LGFVLLSFPSILGGAQVGKFLQLMFTFIGGFAVAFVKGWLLTLVMLATMPLIVFSGATMAAVMSKLSSQGQLAYAEAGTTVEQVISAIRTVSEEGT